VEEMKPSELQARVLAGQLLTLAAQKSSSTLDIFSGWLLGGFGAGFAFLLANLDSITQFLSLSSLKFGASLFLLSAALAVTEKLIASFVASGTGSGIEGGEIGKQLAKDKVEFDHTILFREIEKALPWPGSRFAKRAFEKAQAGDFAVMSRVFIKASLLQGLVVLGQAALSLAAATVVVYGLAV
jgi:hypothetical protein